jgi:hypothetical protein
MQKARATATPGDMGRPRFMVVSRFFSVNDAALRRDESAGRKHRRGLSPAQFVL